jgi:sulfate permease, SulP family
MSVHAQNAASNGIAPVRIFATLVTGVICGFLAIVLSIGHGSLLFSSSLQLYLPISIGLALFSTAVMAAIGAFTSSIKGVVSNAQDIPVIALAAVTVAVAGAVPATADETTRLATVMAAVALSTCLTGLAALVLGHFRLGNLIRFAPYPVVGGFLAGTGWLIAMGGIGLVMNAPVSMATLGTLADLSVLTKAACTGVFVIALFLAQTRSANALTLPAIILAALLAFNIGALVLGQDADGLRQQGWLIRLPESGRLWPPISPADLASIDWQAVAAGLVGVPAVIVLTITALLMNATGIELGSQRDVNLNKELRATGLMNLVAGAGAGLPGYQSVSLTLLSARLGAPSRVIGPIVALLALSALVFEGVVLDAVPTVVLGGVLIWLGGGLLMEWLVRSYGRLELREYLVILLIFVIIVGVDFALGILAGLVAAVVLFVFEYGRLDIVRHEMVGSGFQSSVETTPERRAALEEHGHAILIIRLQGFLFFGTADRLRRRIQERIAATRDRPIRFLVIDFRRVTGLDSSSVLSFVRLQQIAAREDVAVVITGMPAPMQRTMLRGVAVPDQLRFRFERDLETGLRWCEDALLARVRPHLLDPRGHQLTELVAQIVGDPAAAEKIASCFLRVEFAPGSRLIEQGTPSNDIILVEAGHAAVEMDIGEGKPPLRLATVGPGAVVGEVAFYLGEPRSASIIAEEPMVACVFSRASLQRLEAEAPDAASKFHESIARMLARRLMQTNRLVRLLAD